MNNYPPSKVKTLFDLKPFQIRFIEKLSKQETFHMPTKFGYYNPSTKVRHTTLIGELYCCYLEEKGIDIPHYEGVIGYKDEKTGKISRIMSNKFAIEELGIRGEHGNLLGPMNLGEIGLFTRIRHFEGRPLLLEELILQKPSFVFI